MMPAEYNPNAAAERLMYQAEGWDEQGEDWKKVASDIRIVVGCLRMYSERLSEFQIAPSLTTVENYGSAIIAAAEEIIRCGYSQTNGVMTLDTLKYRLVGIIARHVVKPEPQASTVTQKK